MTAFELILISVLVIQSVGIFCVLHLIRNVKITIQYIPPATEPDKPRQPKTDGLDMGHKYFS